MSVAWLALDALAERGWSQKREDALLATPITAALVEQHLDRLTAVTARISGEGALQLVSAAVAVVDPRSETGIRLRLQEGVLTAESGDFAVARAKLEDAYLDAGQVGSRWAAVCRANLAMLGVREGDLRRAKRWLTQPNSQEVGAADVLMASVRAALAKPEADSSRITGAAAWQQRVVAQYVSQVGAGSPTALVAMAAIETNEFQAALAAGRTVDAMRILESVELTVQRISAALGMKNQQTLAARLNFAAADFSLARARKDATELLRATGALRGATVNLETELGSEHPQVLVARVNLAAAEFEAARWAKSTEAVRTAFRSIRAAADAIMLRLGERHPHSVLALVNTATAGFELARAGSGEVTPEAALKSLETAHLRAEAVLGVGQNTTRVLYHELMLCRQWVFGEDNDEGAGEGTVRTRRRTEAQDNYPRRPGLFDQEYLSIDHAGELLRRPRSRAVAVEDRPVPEERPGPDPYPGEPRPETWTDPDDPGGPFPIVP